MEKIIHALVLFFCFTNLANAQLVVDMTASVFNFENIDLTNEFTELVMENFIGNESSENINLRWTFVEGTCPEEWDFFKADENITYTPAVTSNVDPSGVPNMPLVLEPGETESPMFIFLRPRQVAGCCQVAFEFSDAGDPTATPIAVATYDVFVNAPGDCQLVNGVSEKENNFVGIYPNPTSGVIKINSASSLKNIQVFSIHGQAFGEINMSLNNELDISHLPTGVYFLKIKRQGGETSWAKVSKN